MKHGDPVTVLYCGVPMSASIYAVMPGFIEVRLNAYKGKVVTVPVEKVKRKKLNGG